MYGTQAIFVPSTLSYMFENDVKMYGTQALCCADPRLYEFENDVKMYGTQATIAPPSPKSSLRMI